MCVRERESARARKRAHNLDVVQVGGGVARQLDLRVVLRNRCWPVLNHPERERKKRERERREGGRELVSGTRHSEVVLAQRVQEPPPPE